MKRREKGQKFVVLGWESLLMEMCSHHEEKTLEVDSTLNDTQGERSPWAQTLRYQFHGSCDWANSHVR